MQDEEMFHDLLALVDQRQPLRSGRARGASDLKSLHRMLIEASLALPARPLPVVLRPAAETLTGVKLHQVPAWLRHERETLGLTQQDVHESSGMTCGRLSRLENGIDTNPTIGTLDRLAEALGIELLVVFAAREAKPTDWLGATATTSEVEPRKP
jgi:DNA-binding Xre family transcriptional regulator